MIIERNRGGENYSKVQCSAAQRFASRATRAEETS